MVDGRVWRPQHARLFWSQIIGRDRNRITGLQDRDHLVAAANWLQRAQDVMNDGGVCGRYLLDVGWTSSYPETTGYIIPTLLALAKELEDASFKARAGQCVEFLLSIQLSEGAFPGAEIHENRTEPSVFNTAQIVSGLVAWHAATGDTRALDAAHRAAEWLLSVQDTDGAWRKYVYEGVAATYSAYASCWLAEFGDYTGVPAYLDAARRHLDWVLRYQDPESGWFDLADFSEEGHKARTAVTHSLAYTLWGVLRTSEILNRSDGIQAVCKAAMRVARRLELSRWLPGELNSDWRAVAHYTCLTGNAQMALVWFRLFTHTGDATLVSAALKALDLVKRAQPMFLSDPNIRGGVPGSDPLWGNYMYCAIPNWAAKFFVDALLEKKRVLRRLKEGRLRGNCELPDDVPRRLPAGGVGENTERLSVVMYSSPHSHKAPQMLDAWSDFDFKPLVVFEAGDEPGIVKRVIEKVKQGGFGALVQTVAVRLNPRIRRKEEFDGISDGPDPVAYCRRNNIPMLQVPTLQSTKAIEAVRNFQPDLAIHAGAGILRTPLLSVPRLGTLNAHMGLLPYYRGMNVAEWARFNHDPVGCTVHLIDKGIDSGPILCVRIVDTSSADSVATLRAIVDREQIALLGEVVRVVADTGNLPPARVQDTDEGRQFYRMHPELTAILERELRRMPSPG